MRLCVLDLEMNQPSGNIIQIGAACYDIKQDKIISTFLETVNPGEKLSEYIIDLTHISQASVDEARPLDEVARSFSEWATGVGVGNLLASWGSDYNYLRQRVPSQYFTWTRFLDLKQMSTVFQAILPSRKGGGLTSQMNKVGLQFEGRQHNALTDAINTVRLLQVYLDGMRIWYKADSLISNRKKGDPK